MKHQKITGLVKEKCRRTQRKGKKLVVKNKYLLFRVFLKFILTTGAFFVVLRKSFVG